MWCVRKKRKLKERKRKQSKREGANSSKKKEQRKAFINYMKYFVLFRITFTWNMVQIAGVGLLLMWRFNVVIISLYEILLLLAFLVYCLIAFGIAVLLLLWFYASTLFTYTGTHLVIIFISLIVYFYFHCTKFDPAVVISFMPRLVPSLSHHTHTYNLLFCWLFYALICCSACLRFEHIFKHWANVYITISKQKQHNSTNPCRNKHSQY